MKNKKMKKPLMRKKKVILGEEEKLVQPVTFKSGGTLKFEPLKVKRKFKSLKADELKFVPFELNFSKFNISS